MQTTDVNFRLNRGNRIVFRHPETNEEIRGRVVNRAGKSTGRYKDWWNIENLDTGETASHDVSKIDEIRHMEDEQEDQVENVFVQFFLLYNGFQPDSKVMLPKGIKHDW